MKKIKKYFLSKSFNIIKSIKACINCHKIFNFKNYFPDINKKTSIIYKELLNFKKKKKININMNYIISNLKNKYIIEISKYFYNIIKINLLKIKFIKYYKYSKNINFYYIINLYNIIKLIKILNKIKFI